MELIKNGLKKLWQLVFIIPFVLVISFILVLFIDLFRNGAPYLSLEFIFANPFYKDVDPAYFHGIFGFPNLNPVLFEANTYITGIFPAVYGTILVTLITAAVATPLGVFTGIYLSEYTKSGPIITIIRVSIRNLAGVPSIVYGIFGVFIFVDIFGFGKSALATGFTLGLLTLPWTITASEEAMKTIPKSYREGALALGATKWQSIYTNVLPPAIPGIITGMILGISRAAGETAPILFTGVVASIPLNNLDWYGYLRPDRIWHSLSDKFMALSNNIYYKATEGSTEMDSLPEAYATAITLLLIIVLLNVFALVFRSYMRQQHKIL